MEIWTHVRAYHLERSKAEGIDHTDEMLPTREAMLKKFDLRLQTASSHLSGLQQALNDNLIGLPDALANGEATAHAFVAFYKQSSGRDFLDDMGDPKRKLQVILDKGRLDSDDEFQLFKLVFDDDLSLLSKSQLRKAAHMMAEYESR